MNKSDLQAVLNAQRAQRQARMRVAPTTRNNGTKQNSLLLLGAILFGVGVFMVMLFLSSKQVAVSSHAPLGDLPVQPIHQEFTASTAANAWGTVCTDVPDGRLHVRVAPGEGNAEVGYLNEGETITISTTPTQIAPDGGKWLFLLSPLSGWVNSQYICK